MVAKKEVCPPGFGTTPLQRCRATESEKGDSAVASGAVRVGRSGMRRENVGPDARSRRSGIRSCDGAPEAWL